MAVTNAVLDHMKLRRLGRVVFISSQAGQLGLYGYTAYSASKFALMGLAQALQMEVCTIDELNIFQSQNKDVQSYVAKMYKVMLQKCTKLCCKNVHLCCT